MQYTVAHDVIKEYKVDLMALTNQNRSLPGKILWFLHPRTQVYLKLCAEARDKTEIDTESLEWCWYLQSTGQGMGSILESSVTHFLREDTKDKNSW